MSDKKIKRIIVLGGGSSGWMSASYIAKALNFEASVTLIESKQIGRIGVGEATLPTIKEDFFDFLEIPEAEWMPKCDATYKMGIRFANWRLPKKQGGDHYYHIFGEIPSSNDIPLSHVWNMKRILEGQSEDLAYAAFPAPTLCDHYKSPIDSNGEKAAHYAYHFDAMKVADFLRDWSVERGVTHIYDQIAHAEQDENGNISAVLSKWGNRYEADLFIDCSGFAALLIGQTLKEEYKSFSKSLVSDSAVAINIPDSIREVNLRPYTTSTALSAGWVWETPLFGRTGNGYVYSSQFLSQDEAEQELRDHFGRKADGLDVRHIKFKSGKRERSWVKNVVSIGLSSGFLEPLESTGIYFIYAALNQLIQHFPDKDFDPALRNKFNERINYMVEDVKDFIVMHYCTSPREDSAFWRVNKYDLEIPDALKSILELHQAGIPIKKSYQGNEALYSTFESSFDRFWTNSNYQAVLAGVGYLPEKALPILNYRSDVLKESEQIFKRVKDESKELLEKLPSQYDYLAQQKEKATDLLKS